MVKLHVDNVIQDQLIVNPEKKRQTAAKFAVRSNLLLQLQQDFD